MQRINYFSALILLVISYCLIAAHPGDVMTELGIETPKLRQDILQNLNEPRWFFFNATGSMRQTARRLPEASRTLAVRSLGRVVRAYVESAAFSQAWLQNLRLMYSYDETYTDEYIAKEKLGKDIQESAMKEQVATQMAAMEQGFAHMDPATLKMASQAQLNQEEQELASLADSERTARARYVSTLKKMMALPPAEFKKQYLTSLKQQMKANVHESNIMPKIDNERLARARQQKAQFDAHADFRPLLKNRLQDFISLSETVDFEARLIPIGRKQLFANPVYEHKPAEWKFLYRLGKEPANEACLFAKQWLAELP